MDRLTSTRVFVTVVDRGSLSAAAGALDMSRAMVSRYLAEMERWAGARLLHRSTRRLGLTPAGEQALARARRMLEMAEEIEAAGEAAHEQPRGLLRLTCSTGFGQQYLAPAVADFIARYPQTAVEALILNRLVNLVEERIDLALRITAEPDPNLIARRLAPCRSVICAAPSYLQARGLPRRAEDLAPHNCLSYSYFGKSLWEFERDDGAFAVPVSGTISSNDSEFLLQAALHGAGIVMQPSFAVAGLLREGRLVALLPEESPKVLSLYAVYSSRRQMSAALRAMLDFLAQRWADAPWDAGPAA